MFGGEETKPLAAWRLELRKFGKPHWLRFYSEFMGCAVSDFSRFYRHLNLYGEWAMFEAIVSASAATLTGDPLAYVLTVARNKWREEQQSLEDDEANEAKVKKLIEDTAKRNDALAKKLHEKKKRKYTKRASL
jgi:hypothetical protein